jgi:disease resistance protein RPM1
MLQSFRLHARLEKLPDWIPNLQNVVQLKLAFSHLNEDPMESLQNLQNLLSLSIIDYAYEGESLRFQDGGFQKLKELLLAKMRNLNSIVIEKGAMLSLKKLELRSIPQLETVPTGIQNIEKLQVLSIWDMHTKFVHGIAVVEHVPHIEIDGDVFRNSNS